MRRPPENPLAGRTGEGAPFCPPGWRWGVGTRTRDMRFAPAVSPEAWLTSKRSLRDYLRTTADPADLDCFTWKVPLDVLQSKNLPGIAPTKPRFGGKAAKQVQRAASRALRVREPRNQHVPSPRLSRAARKKVVVEPAPPPPPAKTSGEGLPYCPPGWRWRVYRPKYLLQFAAPGPGSQWIRSKCGLIEFLKQMPDGHDIHDFIFKFPYLGGSSSKDGPRASGTPPSVPKRGKLLPEKDVKCKPTSGSVSRSQELSFSDIGSKEVICKPCPQLSPRIAVFISSATSSARKD